MKPTASRSAEAGSAIDLHVLHKLPTPYTDKFYRRLSRDPGVQLQVHHLWSTAAYLPWKTRLGTGYCNRYMKLFMGVDWYLVWLASTKRNAFFLVNDWGHLASLAVIVARAVRRAPVGMWADTPQEQLPRPLLKQWIRRLIFKVILPRLDVVFATGRPGVRAVIDMGVQEDRTVNLPMFVDLDEPERARLRVDLEEAAKSLRARVGCAENGSVFTLVGQIATKKGFDIGVEAFARFAATVNSPVGLIIAGDGPERSSLEAHVARRGITDRVAFLGWTEPESMLVVYLATDVLVHPARWEPYGVVVLEAMSWGKPVIGSDVCGSVVDRIESGANGLAFSSEDVNALAELMRRLVVDRGLRSSMGQAARATAEEWPMERGLDILRAGLQSTIARRAV